MHSPKAPRQKIPTPVHLFATLLLIISAVEILVMFLLPLVVPSTNSYLQNFADAFFLAILSAPFIWILVAGPLRSAAMNEISRTKALLEHIVAAVINFDEQGVIESLNPAAEKMFGCGSDEIIGQHITRLIPAMQAGSDAALAGNTPSEPEKICRIGRESIGCRQDGQCFPIDISITQLSLGGRSTAIAIIDDISGRKQYEEQLEYQANHDELTNLPNRNLLTDRLRQALLMARRNHQEVAIFFVDLDNFKFINDTLGHDIGDRLLKIVAERLSACVRSGDTVARQGGDEFVIIVSNQAVSDHTTRIAAKILQETAQPFCIDEHELIITCSIGISLFPRDGEDVQALIKNADVAMYRAKEQGRNRFQFFTGEMNARSLARMTMEKYLRRALEKNELLLYYQPKVNLYSGRVASMEALLRWQSPELGMVSPANFIPLAEETGLIEQIGEWVLRTACRQNKAWQDADLPPLTVAVNLSARQLRQPNITSLIRQVLRETGLGPRWLELEITESMVMQDVDRVTDILGELKGMGIYLAMDDFGTGFSSLSYLKRFPFDKLKIDQSFVRDITSDPDNAAIAKAVIAMAHSLHLKVIAEGVETEGQLNYLRAHGCDEMQGYYFSRPVPVAEFEQLLRAGHCLHPMVGNEPCAAKTLLVVDDEKEVTTSLQRLFVLEGYCVLMAQSAEEGFELLANNRVSVVISDQSMPIMTGTEFLRRVKELYPHIVRIILSGHADLATATDAINHGAVYKILSKPWNEDLLRGTVNEAFNYYESVATRYED